MKFMATLVPVPTQPVTADGATLLSEVAAFVADRLPQDTYDHSVRVAAYAQTDDERIVALLHDAVEDGHATVDDLYGLGIPSSLVTAVCILTREPKPTTQTYDDYLGLILTYFDLDTPGARVAAKVKMYDIFDHLHPHRVCKLKPKRVERYSAALRKLALAQARPPDSAATHEGNGDRGVSFSTFVEIVREAMGMAMPSA
jgi:hypothetical protein